MLTSPPSDGIRSARRMRYWARARSTLSIATRRSRLFSSACATSWSKRGSAKKSRQPMSATSGAPSSGVGVLDGVVDGSGHSTGIDGDASGTGGCRVAQPVTNSTAASASGVISVLVMGRTSRRRVERRCGRFALAEQALYDHEEQWNEEQAEQGTGDHAAEHAG